MDRRVVTPEFSVSPQLRPEDVPLLAAAGVRLIVNHRPDGEEPGQPTGAQIAEAAEAAGLAYAAVPVAGMPPSPEHGRATLEAIAAAKGPTHAYCRSGTRSLWSWAIGEEQAGARTPQELVRLADEAGYDMRPLFRDRL